MVNMNEIISNNIINIMKQSEKKQVDLAGYLGVSKQIVSKMLSGARIINAIELQKISEFLNVSSSMVSDSRIEPDCNKTGSFSSK